MLNFAVTEFYEVRLSTILGSSTERASRKLNGRGLDSGKVEPIAALLTSNAGMEACHLRGLATSPNPANAAPVIGNAMKVWSRSALGRPAGISTPCRRAGPPGSCRDDRRSESPRSCCCYYRG